MPKCTFCGNSLIKGKGKMYVYASGKLAYFCTNKCEKNLIKLKRKPLKVKWTEYYRKEHKKLSKEERMNNEKEVEKKVVVKEKPVVEVKKEETKEEKAATSVEAETTKEESTADKKEQPQNKDISEDKTETKKTESEKKGTAGSEEQK